MNSNYRDINTCMRRLNSVHVVYEQPAVKQLEKSLQISKLPIINIKRSTDCVEKFLKARKTNNSMSKQSASLLGKIISLAVIIYFTCSFPKIHQTKHSFLHDVMQCSIQMYVGTV